TAYLGPPVIVNNYNSPSISHSANVSHVGNPTVKNQSDTHPSLHSSTHYPHPADAPRTVRGVVRATSSGPVLNALSLLRKKSSTKTPEITPMIERVHHLIRLFPSSENKVSLTVADPCTWYAPTAPLAWAQVWGARGICIWAHL